jgi:hypothetical protein
MHVVGVIEIVAGLAVGLKPPYGAYLAAAWPGGIVVDLLTDSGYYDIALRDFGADARGAHAGPARLEVRPAVS